MSLRNAILLKLTGNTYPNREYIRQLGGQYDCPHRCWWIDVKNHPLNTAKKRGELERRILWLAEVGVVIERKERRG